MNLFEFAAKITLDSSEYERGLSKAASMAQNIGSKIGGAVSTIAKISTAAMGAAATGVGAVVKQSVAAYGEYEQLVGGIRKLYTTDVNDATDRVIEYANNAYKTVGMSANEYMSSTTAFTAKLLSDFGQDAEKTADYADKAMRQIADNANTFGKFSVQDLTQVYQALARGSYMTLDNLSLGVSGTKAGMQELLDKAHEITGLTYDIDNFSDVIDAIGAVQDKLGITGTTAAEASKTITGSLASVKAAWQNLLVGMAQDGADFDKLINNLVEGLVGVEQNGKRVGGVINNIMPRVQTALKGVSTVLSKVTPILTKELPGFVRSVLPDLLDAAGGLVDGLVAALPDFVGVIAGEIPGALTKISGTFATGFPKIIDAVFGTFANNQGAITQGLSTVMQSIGLGLVSASGSLATYGPQILDGLFTSLGDGRKLLDIGGQILRNLGSALLSSVDVLSEHADSIIDKFVGFLSDNSKDFGDTAGKIIAKLATALGDNASSIVSGAADIITELASGLLSSENIAEYASGATNIINGLADCISKAAAGIGKAIPPILSAIANGLVENLPGIIGTVVGALEGTIGNIVLELVDGALDLIPAAFDLLLGFDHDRSEDSMLDKFTKSKLKSSNSFFKNLYQKYQGIDFDGTYPEWITMWDEEPTENTANTSSTSAFDGIKYSADAATAYIEQAFANTVIGLNTGDAEQQLDNLKARIDTVLSAQESVNRLSEKLNSLLSSGKDTGGEAAVTEKLLMKSKEKVDSFIKDSSTAVDDFAKKLASAKDETATVTATISDLETRLTGIATNATDVATQLKGTSDLIAMTMTDATGKFADAMESVPTRIGAMWSQVQAVFANAGGYFSTLGSTVATNFMTGPSTIPSSMSQVWTQIKNAFAVGDATQWGQDLAQNFAAGIDKGFSAVTSAIDRITTYIANNLKHSTPKEGPLAGDDKWSVDMMDNWINGISGKENELHNQVKSTFDFRDYMQFSPASMTASAMNNTNAILSAIHELTDALRSQTIEMDGEKVADLIDARLGTSTMMKARV